MNAGVDPRQGAGCTVDQIVDHSPPAATLETHDTIRLHLHDLVILAAPALAACCHGCAITSTKSYRLYSLTLDM